jgi:hypothetical protein
MSYVRRKKDNISKVIHDITGSVSIWVSLELRRQFCSVGIERSYGPISGITAQGGNVYNPIIVHIGRNTAIGVRNYTRCRLSGVRICRDFGAIKNWSMYNDRTGSSSYFIVIGINLGGGR